MVLRHIQRTILTVVVLIAIGLPLLARKVAETENETEWVEHAQEVLLPFKQKLMSALQEGVAKGPDVAIDVCRLEAPRIAAEIESSSVRVGRTSHRLRNPSNAPKPWMLPILQEFRDAEPGAHPYRTAHIDADWVGYAEPIYMKPLCLTCHGTDLPQSISDRLHAAYPQDEATGFALGEFRGMFWVELKSDSDERSAP